MYKATHGTAPSYLSQLVRVADLPGRRSLRSARTNRLLEPSVKQSIPIRAKKFRFDSIRQSDKFAASTLIFK